MRILYLILFFLGGIAFASPTTLSCEFNQLSSPKGLEKEDEFNFRILWDAEKNIAYIQGTVGTSPLEIIASDTQVSFIEITNTKNIMVTTIGNGGKAVHSRNSIIMGELVPSQYYGTCSKI